MNNKIRKLARAIVPTLLVLAHCASTFAGASDYVQNGLVMQLDGIERGDDPSVWTDLSGNGFDWALDSANCTWKDIGLHFDGKGVCGVLATKSTADFAGKVKTIEAVYCNEDPKTASIIFSCGGGNFAAYLFTLNNGRFCYGGDSAAVTGNAFADVGTTTNSFSITYKTTTTTFGGVSRIVKNGGLAEPIAAGNFITPGNVPELGARKYGTGNPFPAKGILMALRVYDRELTREEYQQNMALDSQRFGTPYHCLSRTVTVEATNGGLVSVNDGDYAERVSVDVEEDTMVTLHARPESSFLWWTKDGDVTQLAGEPLEFHLGREDVSYVAHFPKDERLGRYSTTGLICWWDGIANVNAETAHSDTTNVWTSLVGSYDLLIKSGAASFTSNALVCVAGYDHTAVGAKKLTGIKTIEVVVDQPMTDTSHMIFSAGSDVTRVVTTFSGGMINGIGNSGLAYIPTGTGPNTFAFVYDGNSTTFYEGGGKNEQTMPAAKWTYVPDYVTVGSRDPKYGYAGHVYAIRVYDRQLTEAEVIAHAQVDAVRFFGKSEDEHAVADVRGSGAVSVNGGEAKSEQEIDAEPGDEVTLTAVPGEGMSFVAWEAEGFALTGDALKTNPLTFTFTPAVRRITAVFAASGSAEQEVTQYSFDGLAAFWDGVVNVGFGLAHDNDATVWKDLVGLRDLQLIEGNAEFADNALNCVGRQNGAAAGPASTVGELKTVEVVCEQPSSSSVILSNGGETLLTAGSGVVQYLHESYKNVTSTNLATYAFAQMDGRGWVFFENGAERSERGVFSSWSKDNDIYLGSRSLNGGNPFVGRIHAVRLYTRTLSAAELAHHSDIDQRRFFDCAEVPADRGIRFRPDGSAEYRLRVSANRGGQVSVNGVTAGSGDLWFPEGASVTLAAHPDASHQFAGWLDDTRSAILDDAVLNTNVTFAIKSATSVGCSFVRSSVLRRHTASDYVQDGLVAQWDGIERGNDPEVWSDLSGNGRNWALDLANGDWTAQGLSLNGIARVGVFAAGAPVLTAADLRTIEVVYANGAGAQDTIVFVPGADNGYYIYTDRQNHVGYYGKGTLRYGNAVSLGSTNRFNVVCGSTTVESAFVNASPRLNDEMGDYWNVGSEASLGGLAASKPAKGEIMAIRIYNRVLTADERLLNAKLDAIRFLGEPTPAVPGLMILLR